MSKAAVHAIYHPCPSVRRFVLLAAVAGAAVTGTYAATSFMGHGVRALLPVLVVGLVLVGRPLALLGGRTRLDADRITVRRPPLRARTVTTADIGLTGLRRGLLLEWPVLYLRDGTTVELTAPMRFWFRADPAFDRDLSRLRAHVHLEASTGGRQWSLPRLAAGPLLTATAAALVLAEPPWASDGWPLRPHATRLPDACLTFDAKARRMLPGARIDRLFSRSDDTNPRVQRHVCRWNATRVAAGGVRLLDVGRLSVELELDHGVGPTSDAAEAHRAFRRATRIGLGEIERRLPHAGDEADLITERPGGGFAWVTVAVRKANVAEKVDLIYPGREREAAATAEGLARLGISKIAFR